MAWSSTFDGVFVAGHYENDYPPVRYMDRSEEKLLESVKVHTFNVTV